ncbi:hypothetical protein RvY_00527 [Ramazzottius varieornatus]|uniref:Uncharacterized protein n=1 Tax=Ramazzottius varieornatus TaxID=947166 RepID=A0A1D1UKC4_RAMVA|nr:hypothetical protein RvY_00527 [Ramazzottius varieornatus]
MPNKAGKKGKEPTTPVAPKTPPEPVVVPPPPNPKLQDKLSFSNCSVSDKQTHFPKYVKDEGLLDVILHVLMRLEREKQRPADPWQWIKERMFLGKYNPGDKEELQKTIAELNVKRDKLTRDRASLCIAVAKRHST